MPSDGAARTLDRLTPTACGWVAELPEECGRLLGRRVGLEISTRLAPEPGEPPGLNLGEVTLARVILAGLPAVLAEADRRYRAHARDYPGACGGEYAPWVSISRAELAEHGPGRWALVLKSLDGPPDWNIHVEFDGVAFRWIGLAGEA